MARGQILRPGQVRYVGRMTRAGSLVPVQQTARGTVSLVVGSDRDRVIYDVALVGIVATDVQFAEASVETISPPSMTMEVLRHAFRAQRWLTADSTFAR